MNAARRVRTVAGPAASRAESVPTGLMQLQARYCSDCGSPLVRTRLAREDFTRLNCSACNSVHYENPRVITGCLAEWQGRVLLCQRAIAPRIGTWTLPSGYMEQGESIENAAAREAQEEAGASISMIGLHSIFRIADPNQVCLIYRGRMVDGKCSPGPESLAVGLFLPEEIPWEQLSYPGIAQILRRFIADAKVGRHHIYMGSADQHDLVVVGTASAT